MAGRALSWRSQGTPQNKERVSLSKGSNKPLLPEISQARHKRACCPLRRNLAALMIFKGARIALAQLLSFIFLKNK
jgi:hypothetical protein